MNEFERKLQRQPFRDVPAQWRAEIVPSGEALPRASDWTWRDWFWPAPQAWAGLAAIWLLLALLNSLAPRQASARAMDVARANSVPVASLFAFQTHARLVAELALPR
jgi:hypothetical protein